MGRSLKTFEPATVDRKIRPSSVRLREARFEDYDAITSLESRYALDTKSYEEWSDLWLANPAYKNLNGKWPIGWVLETKDHGIAGYIGNIPRSYEFDGQVITTAVTHAWVVDSLYRSYSILLLDQYFNQSNVDLHLSTTVNAQASEAFTSFGSLRTPIGAWDRSLFWITNFRGFASSWAAMKGLRVARPVEYVLSAAMAARNLSFKRALHAHGGSFHLEHSNGFDDRFNAFWRTLKERNPRVLLAQRSREALDWHFKHAIPQGKLWIVAARHGSEISSYSIFCRQDNPRVGLKRMRLIDFQALDRDTSTLVNMVSWALKKCREQGIHMMECIGLSPEAEKVLRSLAPQERALPCWLYYYRSNNQVLAQALTNAKAWRPTLFDGDSSL